MCIAQELDIANLKNHMQRQPLARLLENLHCPQLFLAQRRNQPLVAEASQRLDIVRIPLAVKPSFAAVLQIHNRLTDPLLLALRHLALAVKVPDGLGEELGHIRVLEQAGCLTSEKAGRVRTCHLSPEPVDLAGGWIAEQRSVWTARTDRLERFLLAEDER